MPEALLETWQERGVDIVQGYGLTEAAPNVLCLPPEDAVRKAGFAGKPYPYVDVALRDPETGRLLEGAGPGELVVQGPNVFAGYWRNAEATAGGVRRRLAAHGRHRRARRGGLLPDRRPPEGHVHLRRRERLSGGGRERLHEHPAVADAAVVGVPDERWGEVGIAFVVLAEGADGSEDELLEYCARRLARFKVPKRRARSWTSCRAPAMNKVLKDELNGAARERGGRRDGARRTRPDRRRRPRARERGAADARGACSRRPSSVFAELGYHDASIVKITEAAGRRAGHLLPLLPGKKEIFDELVRDLNRRVRHAMKEASSQGATRARGGGARLPRVLPLHRRAPGPLPDHPAGRVRLAGDAPATTTSGSRGLRRGAARGDGEGEIGEIDPEVHRLGADGGRRADRHALDPLGAARRDARGRARRARADRRLRAGAAASDTRRPRRRPRRTSRSAG